MKKQNIDQIPFKRAKIGKYRLKSQTVFWKDIYNKRMNVESVINVIKRRFNGINFSSRHKNPQQRN